MRKLVVGSLAASAALLGAGPAHAVTSAETILVKPAGGASLGSALDAAGAGSVLGRVGRLGVRVVRVPRGRADAVVARLQRRGDVEFAEREPRLRALGTPNDARFGELYGMRRIEAPAGWDLLGLGGFPASGGPTVGIIDTGIDRAHEDLQGKVVACAATANGVLGLFGGSPTPSESRGCADDNDHGTHVAGTVAATANNGVGVAGVAFNSSLAICKALFGVQGSGSTSGIAGCITYLADKGVPIISMSLGGGASSTLHSAVRYATSKGVLLIAAAGNDGNATANYPAAYPEVVSVAATDQNDARASFSNANADVELSAPGVAVLSTRRGGGYQSLSGTSMATPHVAGAAALIKGRTPTLDAAGVRARLTAAVDDLGPAGRDPQFGTGRLDLTKAAG